MMKPLVFHFVNWIFQNDTSKNNSLIGISCVHSLDLGITLFDPHFTLKVVRSFENDICVAMKWDILGGGL